ncbi:hypothetical protein CEXT_10001 [Caerostris extrusa]|uniref:Uncharacterized protein n=1 Tax=Caerostris extrusa TaxID=172846 RepID=A0AAV4TXF9_CAEEX|nr:hypothetical protein CEXT_10001 [Caerostris extrusa]
MLTSRIFDSWTRVHQSIRKKHTHGERWTLSDYSWGPSACGVTFPHRAIASVQYEQSFLSPGLCKHASIHLQHTSSVGTFKFLGPAISPTGSFSMVPASMNKSCPLWCIRKISTDEY